MSPGLLPCVHGAQGHFPDTGDPYDRHAGKHLFVMFALFHSYVYTSDTLKT